MKEPNADVTGTELELRDLQLDALAVDDGPVLAPVELESFASSEAG